MQGDEELSDKNNEGKFWVYPAELSAGKHHEE
jgi:hypothetical protein